MHSVSCGNGSSVNFKDFAKLRNKQNLLLGINQSYFLFSKDNDGVSPIDIVENTSDLRGKPVPGVPDEQYFTYAVQGPLIQLVSRSTGVDELDPLSFMSRHWDAVCWGSLQAANAARRSGETPQPRRRK